MLIQESDIFLNGSTSTAKLVIGLDLGENREACHCAEIPLNDKNLAFSED
jgi:hypothetical protein